MEAINIEVPNCLKPFVKRFWYAKIDMDNYERMNYRILADGAQGIIFQHNNGNSVLYNGLDHRKLPIGFIYGQKTNVPCVNYFNTDAQLFGVDFYPTAFQKIFNINAAELTNTLVNADELLPMYFTEQLLELNLPEEKVQLFIKFFLSKIENCESDILVDYCVNEIIRVSGTIANSKEWADKYAISQRTFQRRFKKRVGVNMETFGRIIKFQKSVQLIQRHAFSKLSDIAYTLDYADQSHFGRDFRLFAGCSPKFFVNHSYPTILANSTQCFDTTRIIKID